MEFPLRYTGTKYDFNTNFHLLTLINIWVLSPVPNVRDICQIFAVRTLL